MLWLRVPEKVYFKKGCMPVALQELRDVRHAKKVFIVTDNFLYEHGVVTLFQKTLVLSICLTLKQ